MAYQIIHRFTGSLLLRPEQAALAHGCSDLISDIKTHQPDLTFQGKKTGQYARLLKLAAKTLSLGFLFEIGAPIRVIVVDEFQDLDSLMVQLLKKILKQNPHLRLIAAGDRTQCIRFSTAAEHKRIAALFDGFDKIFGEARHIKCNENYRCSSAVQHVANVIGQRMIRGYIPYKIKGPANPGALHFHFCADQGKIANKIQSLLRVHSKLTVAILCSSSYEVKALHRFRKEAGITVETIHQFKGGEADVVILASAKGNLVNDIHWATVLFVGITRARHHVHYVTSFPEHDVLPIFEGAQYTVDHSKLIKQAKRASVTLGKTRLEMTHKNISTAMIDSLEIDFAYQDLPFIPMEQHSGAPKRSRFLSEAQIDLPIKYLIRRGNGKVTFEFHDLNPLKGRGMNDSEILNFLRETISGYFSHRAFNIAEKGRIKRLDLCRIGQFNHPAEIQKAIHLAMRLHAKTTRKIGSDETHTLYMNAGSHRARHYDRVITAYCPGKKSVNSIDRGFGLIKLESRWRSGTKAIKRIGLNLSLGELSLEASRPEKLSRRLSQWLKYDLPMSYSPREKTGLLKKRYAVDSMQVIEARLANAGPIKRREKEALCHILSDLIRPEDQAEWSKLFGR
ncbi:MAG: ATP-binding domain-containing protein [Leptospirales bacterium]|nr:ATP-binding domain-containing protein [Leptospirales bacterium]